MMTLTIHFKNETLAKIYPAERYTFNPIEADGFLLIEDGKTKVYIDVETIEELQVLRR